MAAWTHRLRLGEPSPCRAAGSMVAEPLPVSLEAYKAYSAVNLNDPDTWPSVSALEAELASMLRRLLGSWAAAVLPTGGGSESVLTALYAARELTGRDTVVASRAAHASVAKAATVLGMRLLRVPVDEELRMDTDALEALMAREGGRVAAVVVTAGLTDNGAVDPLEEAAWDAWGSGALVYVDAAWGGLPLAASGRLRVPSGGPLLLGLDFHKHLVPPPSGALVASADPLLEPLVFEAPYMPLGLQAGLPWTRTAAGLAAAVEALRWLGPQGLRDLVDRLYRLAGLMARLGEEAGAAPLLPRPETPLVALRVGPRLGEAIAEARRRGWVLYPSSVPGALRYVAKWCHRERDVEEIALAIAEALKR